MYKQLIVIVFLVVSFPGLASGAWVDDWLQQRTSTTPGYFSGQERGYYSGGSFSTRWHNTNTFPVTLETPRVKSGCGGIDVFMGGASFMNTDYLVDKLQGILSNAAAVAFDLGLKTLCEQCSNTIKNFEAIADKLNSMQIEECSASKELVGIVADKNGFRSADAIRERLGTAIKKNKLTQGISEMWDIATKQDQARNNVPQAGDVARITRGCNADITATFLSGGSLLANVGSRMHMPTTYIDLIRGLVGDVQLSGPATAYRVAYIPPCPENNPDDIESFANGDVYAKGIGGTCRQITDTNRDLDTYVSNTLNQIADKIARKGGLSQSERDFLDANPLSALPIIKTALATNTRGPIIASLANITAKAYALQMMSDLYVRAEYIARKAKEILEKKAGPAPGQPSEDCAAVIFAGNADQDLDVMLDRIRRLQNAARGSYIAAAKQMNTILDYLDHMKKVESQMKEELVSHFGKEVAERVMQ